MLHPPSLLSLAQSIFTRKNPKRILAVQTHLVQVVSTALTRTRTRTCSLFQPVDILDAPIAPQYSSSSAREAYFPSVTAAQAQAQSKHSRCVPVPEALDHWL